MPVVSNVSGEYMREPQEIREALKRQVTSPVLWHRSIQRLFADGYDTFYEAGPGKVLTGLMRRIDKTKRAVNISTVQYEL